MYLRLNRFFKSPCFDAAKLFGEDLLTKVQIALLTLIQSGVSVAQIAPDDPSIASDLSVWRRDASSTFNSEAGIWTDSSGNERNAVPAGEVNIAELRTFLAPYKMCFR